MYNEGPWLREYTIRFCERAVSLVGEGVKQYIAFDTLLYPMGSTVSFSWEIRLQSLSRRDFN